MNPLLLVGVCINAVITMVIGASGEYPDVLVGVMGFCVALSVVGVILIATGAKKPGAILAMIGCVVFVPIGLIGFNGARKVLDELKSESFEVEREKI